MKTQSAIVKGLCAAGFCILSMAGTASAQSVVFNTPIPQYPGGGVGIPIATGGTLIANGGDVKVTFLGAASGTSYSDWLFLATPGNPYSGVPGIGGGTPTLPLPGDPGYGVADPQYGGPYLFNNFLSPVLTTVDLGTYAAGTEVEFGLWVQDSSIWYDGPGIRNIANINGSGDGAVHAYIVNNFSYTATPVGGPPSYNGTGTYVGFEDLDNRFGADDNYSDLAFLFNGVTGQGQVAAPDASMTASLLALSLGGLMGMARRFRK